MKVRLFASHGAYIRSTLWRRGGRNEGMAAVRALCFVAVVADWFFMGIVVLRMACGCGSAERGAAFRSTNAG